MAYTTLVAVQNATCRQEAFAQREGRAAAQGNDLTISFGAGSLRNYDDCGGGKTYMKTIPAAEDSFKWHIQKDEDGVVSLCLKQGSGEEFCYRKIV